MPRDSIKIIMGMLIITANAAETVDGSCVFTQEWLNDRGDCVGQYECSETADNIAEETIIRGCNLLRPGAECDYPEEYCEMVEDTTKTYWLQIEVVNASDNTFTFYKEEISDHVVMITLTNGNCTFIPGNVYSFTELLVLDVSQNKIHFIDSAVTMRLKKLNVFNASFNLISELEVGFYEAHIESNLTVLDLSYNNIKFIPDYYFSKLYNLRHVNISHNMINNLNLLTFEGLTRLETLHLSNNNIQEIGMTLARFSNLKKLTLNHNNLSSIEENNFNMLLSLTELNLSFNKIAFIDDLSFQKITSLTCLLLNDNKIKMVSKSMFVYNIALQEIEFSNNEIHEIEPFSFKRSNITVCNFKNNALTSLDHKSIFEGIRAKELDLSVNNIKSLSENLFSDLHSDLQRINLSRNSISRIHQNTFRALIFLREIDLSNNNLQTIEFDMTDLVSLFLFNAENNQIKKITKETFRHLKSLNRLNLSNNSIAALEKSSFQDLERLRVLNLSNNDLPNVLLAHTFNGLPQTSELYLMYSNINYLQDAAFYSMTNLKYFNASFGDIKILGYNTFNGTNIWILDLSHNNLEIFNVNNTYLKYVEKIFLNENRIKSLEKETFYGLNYLKEINLNNNNVLRISIDAFLTLRRLSVLHLSSNEDITLDGSVFTNISTLREVELKNICESFNFKNTVNASIVILDATSSNIDDINAVMVYQLTQLQVLLLNSNKIQSIDRHSFQNLSCLTFLDLSNNIISIIKPGSFTGTRELSSLNLHNNNLEMLSFGVFDGLPNLRVLNLSSNSIHVFQSRIFHNIHKLAVVSLEDNLIENIDFNDIKVAAIPKIAIGGNLIPCDILVASKQKEYYGVRVTSEKLNFHVENVDGISCTVTKLETNRVHGVEKEPLQLADLRDGSGLVSSSARLISNQLDTLKSAVYFEASCLLLTVFLLLGIMIFVYVKLGSKLVRTYSLSNRRYLTANEVEMEL